MNLEKERQDAKEKAVLLALQHNLALIRRGLEIHGMKKDGTTVFVSQSKDYGLLWKDTFIALKKRFKE